MGTLQNIITPLHKRSTRSYIDRMVDEKIKCMGIAKRYSQEYWDGDRRYGYGGYKYDGRWKVVAEKLIKTYNLSQNAKILDVGCGKGFLLHEFKELLPECEVKGIDSSEYAIENAIETVKKDLLLYRAQDDYPFNNDQFDLVYTNTTLHNLNIIELYHSIREIERVGKSKFINVESYRNDTELFNLQCWALTCESFFRPEEWTFIYNQCHYTGDYEFIYFE